MRLKWLAFLLLRTFSASPSCPWLALVKRVTQTVQLIDPSTLNRADITDKQYWKETFGSVASTKQLIEFTVMDIGKLFYLGDSAQLRGVGAIIQFSMKFRLRLLNPELNMILLLLLLLFLLFTVQSR